MRIEKELMMARILLVEDDDQLRTMLNLLLVGFGHEVWETPNGWRVCNMHRQQRFDLVITDLVMPDKEGLEVIMELRRGDHNVRIIAMSGMGQGSGQEYLGIAQQLGATLILSKPFGEQEFLESVRLALANLSTQ
jgi:DNA-binding response OmpR family regulator